VANYSQTRDKERINTAALLQELKALAQQMAKAVPSTQFQYVDVTFNSTAHGDTEIRHSLSLRDPEQVRAIPVEWRFPSLPVEAPCIYKDTSASRRPWGQGYLILRCNLAGAQARLLLLTEPIR
jgi:hypothetical protein